MSVFTSRTHHGTPYQSTTMHSIARAATQQPKHHHGHSNQKHINSHSQQQQPSLSSLACAPLRMKTDLRGRSRLRRPQHHRARKTAAPRGLTGGPPDQTPADRAGDGALVHWLLCMRPPHGVTQSTLTCHVLQSMPLTAAVLLCLCACVQGPAIVAFASTMSDANDVHGWFR